MKKFYNAIDSMVQMINSGLKQSIDSYCLLNSHFDEKVFICNDCSLMSIFKVEGIRSVLDQKEFSNVINSLYTTLSVFLNKKGHSFQIIFESEPDSRKEIRRILSPSRKTIENFGMQLDVLYDDWENALATYCKTENMYFVLWTKTTVLSKNQLKKAQKERQEKIKRSKLPYLYQDALKYLKEIGLEHSKYINNINEFLRNKDFDYKLMSVKESIKTFRNMLYEEYTGKDWEARLTGDKFNFTMPDESSKDMADFFYPSIKSQIFHTEGEDIDRKTILIGDNYHCPFNIELMPMQITEFEKLYRNLENKSFPWRVSFLFEPEGLEKLSFYSILSSIFKFTSSDNVKFSNAIEELKMRELNNDVIVQFSVSFDTWVHKDSEDAIKKVHENSGILSGLVQSWGGCETTEILGDPLVGVMSTIPVTYNSCAKRTAAPLSESLEMIPLERLTSPWKEGSSLFRTGNGKLYPYAPLSSKQTSWINLGFASMGKGKSVQACSQNFAFLTQAGLSEIPYVTIVDIGPSSKGLINLMKAALPHMQHLFIYERLINNAEYSINPFDTPLGFRFPTSSQRNFLINLINLLCTPLGQDTPPNGVDGLVAKCIDRLYDENSDKKKPKLYSRGTEERIDEIVKSYGLDEQVKTTWWEITDSLFKLGFIEEAYQAQRNAVPLLEEIGGICLRKEFEQTYSMIYENEPITKYVWRCIGEAISAFPVFSKITKFDLGPAKVVSLDLDEVTTTGGENAEKQAGVFYMLARYVGANKFFFKEEDVKTGVIKNKEVLTLPKEYINYHIERAENMRKIPKRLCYDEAHRIFKRKSSLAQQITQDIITLSRESRKWNLDISLYSQEINDFPDTIIELANTVFMLGANTTEMGTKLANLFGLNDKCKTELLNIGKPSKEGSKFIGLFRTDSGTVIQQVLYSTLGPTMIWAFSSTAEDTAVRDKLFKKYGIATTLLTLTKYYPGGSVKSVVEQRRIEKMENGLKDNYDVIDEIVNELSEKIERSL